MKIWNTKFALTRGILEHEAKDCGDGMVMLIDSQGPCVYLHGEGKNWHRTREGAVERAEDMKTNQLAFLQKQIKKIGQN